MFLGIIAGIAIGLIILLLSKKVDKKNGIIKNNSNGSLGRTDNMRSLVRSGVRSGGSYYRLLISDREMEETLPILYSLKRLTYGHERETFEKLIEKIENAGMDI